MGNGLSGTLFALEVDARGLKGWEIGLLLCVFYAGSTAGPFLAPGLIVVVQIAHLLGAPLVVVGIEMSLRLALALAAALAIPPAARPTLAPLVSAAIAIFLDGDDVHAALSDLARDGPVYVFVHGESDHYEAEPSSPFLSLASSFWRVSRFGF